METRVEICRTYNYKINMTIQFDNEHEETIELVIHINRHAYITFIEI